MKNLDKEVENLKKAMSCQEEEIENQKNTIASQETVIANMLTHFKIKKDSEEYSSKETDFTTKSEDPSLEDRVDYLEEVSKIKVLRTCAEMEQHGVKTSGFYNLDPDGDNIGNAPIRAYCDFEAHVTEILHDAEGELIDVSHCDTNLCYTRNITYISQMEQIKSLMDLSTFCDQTIEFDCYMAPLNYGDVQVGVWTDRHGQDQVYFDGEHYGEHLCSCNNYNNCTGQEALHNTCNCDNTAVPQWMEDTGKLTNMSALPVMAFKYGPLTYETQQAKFRVGRLRCGGVREVSRVPHTCLDLKLLGETRPGLYHLQDSQHDDYPKMSFCQLDQPGYEDGMELESHWVKLTSGPGQVFFAVKHSGYNDISNGGVITFDVTVANEGSGMNSDEGVFTAPVDGVYDFKLSALTVSGTGETYVDVLLNDVMKVRMYDINAAGSSSLSRAWAFSLKRGDEVKLIKMGGGLHRNEHGLYFVGMLI